MARRRRHHSPAILLRRVLRLHFVPLIRILLPLTAGDNRRLSLREGQRHLCPPYLYGINPLQNHLHTLPDVLEGRGIQGERGPLRRRILMEYFDYPPQEVAFDVFKALGRRALYMRGEGPGR